MEFAPTRESKIEAGPDPLLRFASYLSLVEAFGWGSLFFRWITFGAFKWEPFQAESTLADWPPITAYLFYLLMIISAVVLFTGLRRESAWATYLGGARSSFLIVAGLLYFWQTRDFYGAIIVIALSGMMMVLILRNTAGSLAYPAGFWLFIFFVIPNVIVLIVSLGDRARLGTVVYPPFSLTNLGAYFDDYARFFSQIGGEYIYLRIFGRSVLLAVVNTLICLLFAYPFAYWIARRPQRYRNTLVFLVMIPFWTNFLVRTYAWMLILRDSGVINNFWSITLHEQAVALADQHAFFQWLADATAEKLPLLFNTGSVLLGLFYGFIPFMILPLYANLDRLDWSLLEAASDLGANRWQSIRRILLPLTMPGIAAGSIIVFIPSLGAYVTPDLMGGAKVSLVGNLLQQQFMTVRDWPFGSAIGFIMMAIMLIGVIIYFRISLAEDR